MTLWSKRGVIAWLAAGVLLFPASSARAQEEGVGEAESDNVFEEIGIRPFGMGSYEFGQIVHGQYAHAVYPEKGKLDHYWMQQGLLQLGLTTERFYGLRVVLAAEGALYFPYTLPSDGSGFGYELLGPRFRFYPHHSEGSFSIGDSDAPPLYVGVGFFPFKYNPDARNFGDYLFRVNPYPQYFPTHFDSPYQRLLGLRINSNPFSGLKLDGMLTSEVYLWPLRDFSLSFLANYDGLKFIEAGIGAIGYRLFPVDERLTTPPPEEQEPAGTDFSFAGTKVILRAAFDPKEFLPFKHIFGKNDLRFYSEVCLNGLKNYPVDSSNTNYPGYDSLYKRTLILLGLNLPAFTFLDVVSIEFEYWPNDFANSYWGAYPIGGGYKQNPNPWRYGSRGTHTEPYGPWHWSVYMKKTVFNHFKFILQFSRDHTILETSLTGTSNGDPQEAMDGLGNWMWMSKIEFDIK
ncbi:MAG: hypothetical protein JXA18_15040 [Chitinispirillaceae bacterium]|nr:hypothetical protein [Chitinispirillaceae bacterium]